MTNLTPEQEKACYEHSNRHFATALRVCIHTGARFGTEFATLTSKHVHVVDAGRMEWRFRADEIKNRRTRVIRITDAGIIEIVLQQMDNVRKGTPIFRNTKAKPWTRPSLSQAFNSLKNTSKKMVSNWSRMPACTPRVTPMRSESCQATGTASQPTSKPLPA